LELSRDYLVFKKTGISPNNSLGVSGTTLTNIGECTSIYSNLQFLWFSFEFEKIQTPHVEKPQNQNQKNGTNTKQSCRRPNAWTNRIIFNTFGRVIFKIERIAVFQQKMN
jgi:hypothetical protein